MIVTTHVHTHRQASTQTHTYTHTHSQTDRQTDRLTDRRMHTHRHSQTGSSPLSLVGSILGTVANSLNRRAAAIFALSKSPANDAALPSDSDVTTTAMNTLNKASSGKEPSHSMSHFKGMDTCSFSSHSHHSLSAPLPSSPPLFVSSPPLPSPSLTCTHRRMRLAFPSSTTLRTQSLQYTL